MHDNSFNTTSLKSLYNLFSDKLTQIGKSARVINCTKNNFKDFIEQSQKNKAILYRAKRFQLRLKPVLLHLQLDTLPVPKGSTCPEVIKLFSYSTQLSKKFILLINVNVEMPTIVGILTFMSRINTTSEKLKARNFFICRCFSVYKQF